MKSFLYYFQIKLILTEIQKKKFNFFVLLTLITMCLEVLGISLIIPIITLLSGSELNTHFDFLGNVNSSNAIFLILGGLMAIITIKVIFMKFFIRQIYKFYTELKVSLSEKVYGIYLNKPYEYHLSKNSATLIRNIDDVSWFVA